MLSLVKRASLQGCEPRLPNGRLPSAPTCHLEIEIDSHQWNLQMSACIPIRMRVLVSYLAPAELTLPSRMGTETRQARP